ncbi:2Fe-2S iron-sulfur cluster-binding protein [Erythrobacter sp. NE805]|uniref:2Fe-2S iron-sulfur cluster-binding protein n=1 Tax=Erythrobacter sp. NE805 TaxID=3389875 RepID=UPI00396AFCA5
MSGWRLRAGGRIDRSRPVAVRWCGRPLEAFAGDTLASALLANGIDIVGRSFKYHRPRGLVAAGYDEPNAIVQVGTGDRTIPNLKATEVEVHDGLEARPVNAWPNAEVDALAVLGLAKRFIPAAFYYKSFMWPDWHLFEPLIRRTAGLGKAPGGTDPDSYEHRHAHVATLVVGGGIAGLAAALEAGRSGRPVLLAEAQGWFGGFAGVSERVGDLPAQDWIAAALAELAAMPHVTLLSRTMAIAYQDHDFVTLAERLGDHLPLSDRRGPRQRLWKVRAGEVVLATGAFERPLVFPGNDLPGVMLSGAAAHYHARFAVAPGRRVVLATNNDRAWQAALDLARDGVAVAAILDARTDIPAALREAAGACGIAVLAGHAVADAKGGRRLRGIVARSLDARGRATGRGKSIACDALLVSGGWNPVVHLHSQAGGSLAWDERLASFVPAAQPQNCRSVGAAAGTIAGAVRPLWQVTAPSGRASPRSFVDFQNDVTAADIALAEREAYRSVEHLKRYTTLGMASDQGKTSNVNGLAIMGELLGKAPADVGTTRFRPPFDPTPLGLFAGHRRGATLAPRRVLPAAEAHQALGAAFEEYGGWMRPAFYPEAGEDERAAVAREVRAVRSAAGLFDASPLGKIEVAGPDAATLLDRMYVGTVSTLKVGRCRYGLMLTEGGIVFDDGVVARLAEDRFLVGTTSGKAAAVTASLREWLQCEWTDLAVAVEDVTTCWAVMNIAGPAARDILARLACDIDLSAEAFPHLAGREGRIEGVPCRIQRVSFSGELSFEIAVPASFGRALHDRLMAAGAPFGLAPFGVESLMVLRIEKGFLHVGSDTDGMTLPQDIGFGGPVKSKASDFVGRRSCLRPDGQRADRRQFVGLESCDGRVLPVGAHIVAADAAPPAASQGWVTSSIASPTLGRPHALAMIEAGTARMGEAVTVWDEGTRYPARIVAPCAYDPEGARMHG